MRKKPKNPCEQTLESESCGACAINQYLHVNKMAENPEETPHYKSDPQRLERLFKDLDKNGDGKIDVNELSEGLKRFHGARYRPGQAQVSINVVQWCRKIALLSNERNFVKKFQIKYLGVFREYTWKSSCLRSLLIAVFERKAVRVWFCFISPANSQTWRATALQVKSVTYNFDLSFFIFITHLSLFYYHLLPSLTLICKYKGFSEGSKKIENLEDNFNPPVSREF